MNFVTVQNVFSRMSWVALIALFLLLVSCAGWKGVSPDGFASYQQGWLSDELRAVSPEGITWRIHDEEQKPEADLGFWKGALRKRMQDAGYRVVDSVAFRAGSRDGWALELSAPMGNSDFSYLVGVVPAGSRMVVVEAAGDCNEFAKRRVDILAALPRLDVD